MSQPTDEIRELERACLDPEVRSDPERFADLLADDFLEIGASGRIWDKPAVLAAVRGEPGLDLALTDLEVVALAPDVVLTTFRVAARRAEPTTRSVGSALRSSLRSSIWVRRSGRWQVRFHQGTPCDSP